MTDNIQVGDSENRRRRAEAQLSGPQTHAAASLTDAAPDPAGKRFAASGVFVALDSFLVLARQIRNAILLRQQNRVGSWMPRSPHPDQLAPFSIEGLLGNRKELA